MKFVLLAYGAMFTVSMFFSFAYKVYMKIQPSFFETIGFIFDPLFAISLLIPSTFVVRKKPLFGLMVLIQTLSVLKAVLVFRMMDKRIVTHEVMALVTPFIVCPLLLVMAIYIIKWKKLDEPRMGKLWNFV